MLTHDVTNQTANKSTHSPSTLNDTEYIPVSSPTQVQRIMHLQRTIGNNAVQRLLAEGKLDFPSVTKTPQQTVQRCGCGCGDCSGVHEDSEQGTTSEPVQAKIQRDDDDDDAPAPEADAPEADAPEASAGTGPEIHLHGQTDTDWNHGEPMPEPFPDTVTVETFDAGGGRQGFNAHGHYDVTFDARTSVTLPDVPAGLTPCQTEAVQAFITGPLTVHENEHVSAFRDNYDGTVSIPVDADRLIDTPANRRNIMVNPLRTEDSERMTAAREASADLDPWNQDIPGLDCQDE